MARSSQEKDSEDEWEVIYEELHRRTDHQIETEKWLTNLAAKFLRFILTLVIVLLTTISIAIKTLTSQRIGIDAYSSDISPLVQGIANISPYIHENLVIVVLLLLMFIAAILLPFALSDIFIKSPTNAVKVLSHRPLEPSLSNEKIGYPDHLHSRDYIRSKVVTEYSRLIESNEKSLEKTKRHWKRCHESLWRGFRFFTVSLMVFISIFVVQKPLMVFLAILTVLSLPAQYMQERISYNDLRAFLTFKPEIDITLFIIALVGLLLVLTDNIANQVPANDILYGFIVIIGSVIIGWKSLSYEIATTATLFTRTSGLSIILFIIFYFLSLNFGSYENPPAGYFFVRDALVSIIFSLAIGLVFLLLGYMLKSLEDD